VELVKDKEGASKGFAFVSMPDQAEADKAISMFNAYSLADNALKVNVAKPKAA
jgi:RNA recognition motif-containing protein